MLPSQSVSQTLVAARRIGNRRICATHLFRRQRLRAKDRLRDFAIHTAPSPPRPPRAQRSLNWVQSLSWAKPKEVTPGRVPHRRRRCTSPSLSRCA